MEIKIERVGKIWKRGLKMRHSTKNPLFYLTLKEPPIGVLISFWPTLQKVVHIVPG